MNKWRNSIKGQKDNYSLVEENKQVRKNRLPDKSIVLKLKIC